MSEYIHEVRNNLDFEAAEIYMQEHPEKTTPERLEEWSRNLASRIYTLRPFLAEAWWANGEYCSDAIDKTILIKKLSDAGGSLVLYPPYNQENTRLCLKSPNQPQSCTTGFDANAYISVSLAC